MLQIQSITVQRRSDVTKTAVFRSYSLGNHYIPDTVIDIKT